jgi:hypothetical protein
MPRSVRAAACSVATKPAPNTRRSNEVLIDHAMAAPLASVGRCVRSAAFPLQLVGRSFQIGRQVEHLRRGIVATKHPGVLAEARGSGPQLGRDLVTIVAGFHPTATPEANS